MVLAPVDLHLLYLHIIIILLLLYFLIYVYSYLSEIEKGTTCEFSKFVCQSFKVLKGESYMISEQHTKQIFNFIFYFLHNL